MSPSAALVALHERTARHRGPLDYYVDRLLIITASVTTLVNIAAGWRDQFPDFKIFYSSSSFLQQGADPYRGLSARGISPNTNLPSVIVALLPFTWLPFFAAAILWLALGFVALFGVVSALAP